MASIASPQPLSNSTVPSGLFFTLKFIVPSISDDGSVSCGMVVAEETTPTHNIAIAMRKIFMMNDFDNYTSEEL